jgi:hypothetical protein
MKLALGGAQFGLDYGFIKNKKIKKNEIYKIKKLAEKFKVSFIDTAISYNDSQSIIGNNKLIPTGNTPLDYYVISGDNKTPKPYLSKFTLNAFSNSMTPFLFDIAP